MRVQRGRRKKHNWKSRHFRPLKFSLLWTKPKISDEHFLLQKKSLPKLMQEIQSNVIKKITWKSRRVKWLRILWPFLSILILLEGTKFKISWLKTFLNWIGCLNRMRHYAGKECEYQQESYAKFMKIKTKGMFFSTRVVKVVLKKSEYEWNRLYLFSSKKTRG